MNFVYKQNNVAVVLNAVDCVFQPLFEVAAVFRARNHSRKVERKYNLVFEKVGHLVFNDCLRKPLYDRAFAHARLADKYGVVLRAAGKDLNYFVYLFLSAYYGVNLALARLLGQIRAVLRDRFIERTIAFLAALGLGTARLFRRRTEEAAEVHERVLFVLVVEVGGSVVDYEFELACKLGDINPYRAENAHCEAVARRHYGKEHVLASRKGIFAVYLYGQLQSALYHVLGARRVAVYVRVRVYGARKIVAISRLANLARCENFIRRAVGAVEHCENNVLAAYIAAAVDLCRLLRNSDYLLKVIRKSVCIFHN